MSGNLIDRAYDEAQEQLIDIQMEIDQNKKDIQFIDREIARRWMDNTTRMDIYQGIQADVADLNRRRTDLLRRNSILWYEKTRILEEQWRMQMMTVSQIRRRFRGDNDAYKLTKDYMDEGPINPAP